MQKKNIREFLDQISKGAISYEEVAFKDDPASMFTIEVGNQILIFEVTDGFPARIMDSEIPLYDIQQLKAAVESLIPHWDQVELSPRESGRVIVKHLARLELVEDSKN